MERRVFLGTLAGGLLAAPLAAGAQAARKDFRIGYLISSGPSLPLQDPLPMVFVAAMRDLGYVEGDNLVIETRRADNKPERLPALAAELVRLNVDVIVTRGDGEVRAAKQATSTIPIVMAPSGDPVRAGYVASLARPGGNVTGLSWASPDLSAKLLEVLKDTVPNLSRIAVLWNAANPMKVLDFNETQRAAQTLGLTVYSIEMKAPSDLEAALAAITRTRPDALLMLVDDVLALGMYPRIADFAVKQRLPSISESRGTLRPVASWHMDRASSTCYVVPPATSTRFSRAPSQPTSPSSSPRSSSWSSTSRPPRPSA